MFIVFKLNEKRKKEKKDKVRPVIFKSWGMYVNANC